MNVRYKVRLADEERDRLRDDIRGGRRGARWLKRIQILLAADEGYSDESISKTCRSSTSTVFRTKKRFVEEGLDAALTERARTGGARLLRPEHEARLTAIACTDPPEGRARWTLELLRNEMVRLTDLPSVSRSTLSRRLKESDLKPWRQKMWCIPLLDEQYVARMEDLLDLYAESSDRSQPVVCFDEKPMQLVGETRSALPMKTGQPRRYDYEYSREGTANLFVFMDAHRPWRHVKVTEQRTKIDFANCMKDLVDLHYPKASRIRVVLDNLSTHKMGALYAAFHPEEARRIARKLEFHYTPKHGSWLNMVEIENGVIQKQCLDRRIPDLATLTREIAAWTRARNASGARVNWRFTVHDARKKMPRAYPLLPVKTPETAN